LARDLITLYKNDTVNNWALDSLISFINQENTPELLYQLVFIRLNGGDSLEASNLLNYIQENSDLSSHDQYVHQQYCDYFGYYSHLIDSSYTDLTLDSTIRDELYMLAEEGSLPGVYARNILLFYDTLVYVEPYVIPNIQEKSKRSTIRNPKFKSVISDELRIYPNPALSYFVIEYEPTILQNQNLELLICDISGKVVKRIDLPTNSNHKIISTKDLNQGFYLCKFVMSDKEILTLKLTVIMR